MSDALYLQVTTGIKGVLREKEAKAKQVDDKVNNLARSKDIPSISACMQNEYAPAKMEIEAAKAMEYFHNTYMPLLINTKGSHKSTDSFTQDWIVLRDRITGDIEKISKEIAVLEDEVIRKAKEGGIINNDSILSLGEKMCTRTYMKASLSYCEYLYHVIWCYYRTLPKHAVGKTLTVTDRAGKSYAGMTITEILPYKEANAIKPIKTIASTIPEPYNTYDEVWTRFYHGTITVTQPAVTTTGADGVVVTTPPPPPVVTHYILWDTMLK